MIKPLFETDDLLNKLFPSMLGGKNLLTDIQVMDIIRKARKIPDRHEGLLIEGLAKLISGHFDEGVELCERSIQLNTHDHVAWLNFGVALASLGHHSMQNDLLWRAMGYGLVEAYLKALSVSAFWVDRKMFEHAYEFLNRAGLTNTSLTEKQKYEVEFMHELGSRLDFIAPFATIAMEIAEAEQLVVTNSHVSGDAEHGYCYALHIDESDPDKLLMVNDMALNKILSNDLHVLDCVTVFVSESH
ncbi:hypothetical protein C3369_06845 [Escherichia sp. ESNIH1]|uniref:hypothetical protein n=1 Tax=Escherichia sp. ESNIH1 TaxID=1985876 RepID=UPI000CDDAAF9|nr:hypothetical protein [Escherichia sp. ESNIH1]POU03535.1 hypothetical protein C3369_06845 [Escherichia sp. ESNIH1]